MARAALVTLTLLMFGCSGDSTVFHIGLQSAAPRRMNEPILPSKVVTYIGLGAESCYLLSTSTNNSSLSPGSFYTCAGVHPVAGGEGAKWKCKTKDGREFASIAIDSVTYDLWKGRLFILSRKAGLIKVHQLKTGPAKRGLSGGQELIELEQSHPEIQDLLKQ